MLIETASFDLDQYAEQQIKILESSIYKCFSYDWVNYSRNEALKACELLCLLKDSNVCHTFDPSNIDSNIGKCVKDSITQIFKSTDVSFESIIDLLKIVNFALENLQIVLSPLDYTQWGSVKSKMVKYLRQGLEKYEYSIYKSLSDKLRTQRMSAEFSVCFLKDLQLILSCLKDLNFEDEFKSVLSYQTEDTYLTLAKDFFSKNVHFNLEQYVNFIEKRHQLEIQLDNLNSIVTKDQSYQAISALLHKANHILYGMKESFQRDFGLSNLFIDRKTETIKKLYNFLMTVNKRDIFFEVWQKVVETEGTRLIDTYQASKYKDDSYTLDLSKIANEQNFMKKFLDYKSYLELLEVDVFMDISEISETHTKLLSTCVNGTASPLIACALARFADDFIRHCKQENISVTNPEFIATLSRFSRILKLIEAKEFFKSTFIKLHGPRLLLLSKADEFEIEKAVIESFAQVSEPNYIYSLSNMIEEFVSANNAFIEFKKSPEYELCCRCNFNFRILTLNLVKWPNQNKTTSSRLTLPPIMNQLRTTYEKYYKEHNQMRLLQWSPFIGSCILNGVFNSQNYQFFVSEYQTAILLLFNKANKYTTDEICTQLNIEADELETHTQPLVTYNVLERLQDEFIINEDFSHNELQVCINKLTCTQQIPQNEKAEQEIEEDRSIYVDAAIMQILKKFKSLDKKTLLEKLQKKLKFKATDEFIQTRIERLIDRDFISQDTANPDIYHYE